MIRKIKYLFLCMLLANICSAQQLPHYSLYMFNDAVINPAVCGSKQYDEITLISRSQWAGFEGAPKTQLLSYNKQQGDKMGLGAVLFNDVTGPISRTGTQLSYAYNVDLSPTYKLSFGLSASVFQFVFDGNKATLHDNTIDPSALGGIEKALVHDATFGTYLFNENYYFGFSLPQLIQSKINFETAENNLKRHYFITSGYNYTINDQFDILPSVMLKSTDASPLQFDINLRTIYNKDFWAGLSYRSKDAVVIMLGMNYENYSFGYSFDRTISDINSYTAGSHGIMIGYKIGEEEVKTVQFLDSDGDGVSDEDDNCPKTAGPEENSGCPILTIEQVSVIDTAFTNLQFIFGKAEITFDSYESLERLGKMLMDNPTMRLRVEGHTDNVGSDLMNMELSKTRAQAIKIFLTDRVVTSNKIVTLYYGEENPIVSNETEEGRAKNRRVELTIFFE